MKKLKKKKSMWCGRFSRWKGKKFISGHTVTLARYCWAPTSQRHNLHRDDLVWCRHPGREIRWQFAPEINRKRKRPSTTSHYTINQSINRSIDRRITQSINQSIANRVGVTSIRSFLGPAKTLPHSNQIQVDRRFYLGIAQCNGKSNGIFDG